MNRFVLPLAVPLALAFVVAGCYETDKHYITVVEDSTVPAAPNTVLAPAQDPPGVVFEILQLSGGTGSGGSFRPGDDMTVEFSVAMTDGAPWTITDLDSVRLLVSGPTFNYQRVLAEKTDVPTLAVKVSDGVYRYTFADPIPANYLPPLNDSTAFDEDNGELSGQPLLDGAYTVGLYGYWRYAVGVTEYRDHGDATLDFLVGETASLDHREVTTDAHCNQCHQQIQAHGGMRRNVTICLMCHTAGAEDRISTAAGGTPGVSIDFRVMIHKIHQGAHLPSVLGVTTNSDGTRKYDATPVPYELVGFGDSVNDFSGVVFPEYPHASEPSLQDAGYSTLLTSDEQDLEDEMRLGAFDCNKCHGDPDGGGPIAEPAQGSIAFSQPTREACGSCHDDLVWEFTYKSNNGTHPANATNGGCSCHSSGSLSPAVAHVHPLLDRNLNPGIDLELTAVAEGGNDNADGNLDPGEKVAITFFVRDESGNEIAGTTLNSLSTTVRGPTHNANLLLNTSIVPSILTGAQPFTVLLPESVELDFAGTSALGNGDTFQTAFAPIRPESAPLYRTRTGTAGGSTTLDADATVLQNFVDVVDPANFEEDDFVVVDDGTASEEYFQIQFVDGNRLWFPENRSYAPAFTHDAGAAIEEVTLTTLTVGTEISVDDASGTITELVDLGDGVELLVNYVTDFVMPAIYPRPLNSSADVTEVSGKWTGKSLADGTYTVALWGYQDIEIVRHGETNEYRAPSTSTSFDFLVGSATVAEPYDLISSPDNCLSCHSDLYFHGSGRRGVAACLACHGIVGSEDNPRYESSSAPATTGVTIDFRTMLHKIHMGADLTNAADYVISGRNGSSNTFDHVVFTSMPRRAQDCVACHGAENDAWLEPGDRDHPTEQVTPAQPWSVCVTCHDSSGAQAHAETQTSSAGVQACGVCHGPNKTEAVDIMHKIRQE